ncbi:MAG: hypothetical protein IT370_18805 [Deltaproteobacteria bacterium]|nr:hypothetical protein [Deltaproteobacteria bacterium]
MRVASMVLLGSLSMTLGCERHQRAAKPPAEPSPTPSPSSQPPPDPTPLQISAVVASVSLADDCAPHSALPVRANGFTLVSTADAPDDPGGAAQAPTGGVGITRQRTPARSQTRRACQQTSMQVTLTAGSTGARSNVEIARVELLDADGQAPLGDLTARNPRHWTGSQYDAWDGAIAPGAMLKTTWDLSAPDWSRLGGSRDAAAGRTFVVRVTLRVAGREDATSVATGKVTLPRKVKVKSPPIMVEPPVMT